MSLNQLAQETSPYLLAHKDNPVHWWPWGEEALIEAKNTNKPILISIGYAACHWCHVMADESFADQETAELMNEKFINIKVDREERHDIDHIYMSALAELGEQTGWPLTMFLTPEGKPYWGDKYFPKLPGDGRPSFKQALEFAETIFIKDKEAVMQNSESLTQLIAAERPKMMGPDISDDILLNINQRLGDMMDGRHGGLRGAPKFPQYPIFNLLWRIGQRFNQTRAKTAVEALLRSVFQGGIYDHLGGGLARYATDEKWLVPHFEKMLSDNALMLELAINLYKEKKSPLLKQRIEETINWLEREMLTSEGAFATSQDADSEGQEGKYYVWTADEIKELLNDDYEFFAKHYDVTEAGNWETKTILNRLQSAEWLSDEEEARLKSSRDILLAAREQRVKPKLDDKILADWNGMTITSLTLASDTLGNPKWLELAENAYSFIKDNMSKNNELSHSYRLGKCSSPAIYNDYAQMIRAALTLYNSTQNKSYINDAISWEKHFNQNFWCEEFGGYFITGKNRNDVIIRGKTGTDEATPNGNAVMVSNLMALYLLSGVEDYKKKAKKIVQCFGNAIAKNIFSHVGLLAGSIDILNPIHAVIVKASKEDVVAETMIKALKEVPAPGTIIQTINANESTNENPFLKSKTLVDGLTTAYICVDQTCQAPITDVTKLKATVQKVVRAEN